jgi:hypothetical protein
MIKTNRLTARRLVNLKEGITSRLWLVAYRVEEGRQHYAATGQLLRQAASCLALALLRLVGAADARR